MNDLIERIAARTAVYPYRVWGFGESIAMQALLEVNCARGAELISHWAYTAPPLKQDPLAHVTPGLPLLELYSRSGDSVLLNRLRTGRAPGVGTGWPARRPDPSPGLGGLGT